MQYNTTDNHKGLSTRSGVIVSFLASSVAQGSLQPPSLPLGPVEALSRNSLYAHKWASEGSR